MKFRVGQKVKVRGGSEAEIIKMSVAAGLNNVTIKFLSGPFKGKKRTFSSGELEPITEEFYTIQNYKAAPDVLNQLEESLVEISTKKVLNENLAFEKIAGSSGRGLDFSRLKTQVENLMFSDEFLEKKLVKFRIHNKVCKLFLDMVHKLNLLRLHKFFVPDANPNSVDLVITGAWVLNEKNPGELLFTITSAVKADMISDSFELSLDKSGKNLMVCRFGKVGKNVPLEMFLD